MESTFACGRCAFRFQQAPQSDDSKPVVCPECGFNVCYRVGVPPKDPAPLEFEEPRTEPPAAMSTPESDPESAGQPRPVRQPGRSDASK